MRLHFSTNIDAPATEVWHKLSYGFGETGQWTSLIDSSAMIGEPGVGAHRECRIGNKVLTEHITRMDHNHMIVDYDLVKGSPPIVKKGSNQWSVVTLSERSCRLEMTPNIQMKWWAAFLGPLVVMGLKKSMPTVLEEFKHWVEKGHPHPRKLQRQNLVSSHAAA